MSIPMHLLLVVAAFCVCLSDGAPDGRIARAKQQRPTRGFKNLEMMTARGFGKRGRPSPRTERDVHDQMPPERTYRAAPTFKSPAVNFGGGYGKRIPEIEPEGDVEDQDQALPERIDRGSFKASSLSFGGGYGKRTPEMEPEGNLEDQSILERFNRAPPTFKPPSVIFARGVGKRRQQIKLEGNVEDRTRSERTSTYRALPRFQTPTVIFGRDVGKRTQENEPEDRRFNPKGSMMVATDFGKRSNDENAEEVYGLDNFWEMLPGSPEREGQEIDDDKLESIPMDWFVNEIVNNPDFARSVVRKFIDINQDGMLSSDELLRNV